MDSAAIPPESRLLLACARGRPGGEGLARIRGLAAEQPPWNRCFDVASAFGLAPLVAINLREAGVAVPADVNARFEAELFSVAAGGLAAARQARDLQVRFAAAGIPAVTYKGPAL